LLEILGGATPLRWTDAPFPVTYGGNTYAQVWFSVGDIVIDDDANQVVDITFPDVGTVIRGLLYAESWSYRPATLREVVFSTAEAALFARGTPVAATDVYILADGRAICGGPISLEEATEPVTLSIVPETDAEGATGPAQEHSFSCRYLQTTGFKGIQCGYAGGALPGVPFPCDGTFATCSSYGNTARYGGSRFAPKPGEKVQVGAGPAVTVAGR
jgi:hypothetical protein